MRPNATVLTFCVAAIVTASSASGQKPVIDSRGVMNAATLAPFGTPGFGAPAGSIATIFGQNLALATMVATQVPLPISLGGVSVLLPSHGTPLPLFYVSPRQINFQIPNNPLELSITVKTPTGVSDSVPLLGAYSRIPGIFTQDGSGCGPAWVFNVASDGSWSLNSPDNSAEPGSLIVVLGTGIGGIARAGDGQPAPSNPPAGFSFIKGWKLDVPTNGAPEGDDALFVGRAPGLIGVDQYNFKLADNTIEGCSIPATICCASSPTVHNSQPVPISIHRGGGKCGPLPPPQSYADLTLLKTTTIDSGSASTTEQLNVSLSAAVGKRVPDPELQPGDCACGTSAPEGWIWGPSCPFPAFVEQPVDIGPLTVSGATLSLRYTPQPAATAFQVVLPAGLLVPETATISAPGGSGAGPFSVTVPVMSDIQFDNPAPLGQIDSNKPFLFRWTGGSPGGAVRVRLRDPRSWGKCECIAKAETGDLTGLRGDLTGVPYLMRGADYLDLTITLQSLPSSTAFTAPELTLGGAARWKRVWYYPNVRLIRPPE